MLSSDVEVWCDPADGRYGEALCSAYDFVPNPQPRGSDAVLNQSAVEDVYEKRGRENLEALVDFEGGVFQRLSLF